MGDRRYNLEQDMEFKFRFPHIAEIFRAIPSVKGRKQSPTCHKEMCVFLVLGGKVVFHKNTKPQVYKYTSFRIQIYATVEASETQIRILKWLSVNSALGCLAKASISALLGMHPQLKSQKDSSR